MADRYIVLCTILDLYCDTDMHVYMRINTLIAQSRSGFVQCNSVDGLFIRFLDSLSLLYSMQHIGIIAGII